ncbi:MAG TPA: hypothetical protein VL098_10240 [Flavipsychrobacter sp.]|nr:hypothetical protein [Flavipsychrobacter sp.]
MRHKKLYTVATFIVFALLWQFSSCKDAQNPPDVSEEKVELKTFRLDRDLATIDTNRIGEGLAALKRSYPDFLDFYLDTLMGYQVEGNYSDTNQAVRTFLTYPDFRNLFDTIAKHYPNTKDIDAELAKGFQYLKHYFPSYPLPVIIYINSNLNNYAAFTYDTIAIGIGLDMYLGEKYPFYAAVGIPEYMTRKLTKAYIPVNVFQSIYRATHPFVMDNRTLLDMMIQRGKEQYFLSKIIPFVDEAVRFGFTKKQLEWCEASEAAVYNFFIDKQFLYSTNLQQVMRYVNDGPNAAGMPAESPGNIGSWIGYRIVKAYAEKNPDADLQKILNADDAQRILLLSKYKPK